ncbi:MAG: hypothetical protein A2204_08250 [Elusimicrobia bacterium RIFOXYA1_FULL_47_7]|nr:MAG: hypothetical protein A2278_06040 [Elusimicrobia bacterium RIFOXYA12_FULL_49_49]OGS08385.1 MAG: hypothetical protein A2204_08250 [Elusimicrobia bacterium RIFOXYA1_FULL_47_7]OGS10868.1 MAG: hypothetical protein A2386_06090 [Elusimicrobia bacterium RIFOXYB1_FULL_48_9]OGS16648.1 MAG: hypothetical protein A2251_04695 [Elusimicrobia bacterium RIFOXYA2_FULL_47_53]OGS25497.1 MAG: hypothetical protein A2339_00270 [Elusimicrobia bacterium RIFOXYB12_FULL_50_12]OGS31626.1 MAG: hypothetical protein
MELKTPFNLFNSIFEGLCSPRSNLATVVSSTRSSSSSFSWLRHGKLVVEYQFFSEIAKIRAIRPFLASFLDEVDKEGIIN